MVKQNNLNTLIFYVTNRCNFKCAHCYYWDSLNKKETLELETIKKIADGVGKLDTLLVAGGEPFLRRDLIEICTYFIEKCGLHRLSIPTNGSMKKKIFEFVKQMHDKVRLRIYVSLDGTREIHNEIRQVDSFDNAIEVLKTLVEMKKEYNFSPLAMITVNNKNYHEIDKLAEILNGIGVHYSITPVRGMPKDASIQPPTSEEWGALVDNLVRNRKFLGTESSFHDGKTSIIKSIHRKIMTKSKTKMYQGALDGKRSYVCKAGDEVGVVDYDGNVFFCELTQKVGNLKDFDYNFNKLWFSPEAEDYRPKVKKCVCTHGCFIKSRYMRASEKLAKVIHP